MIICPDDIKTYFYEETDSTNLRAREYLEHGSLIIAGRQTNGRGRYSREWESPKGNLYMSLVWKVDNLNVAGQYSFLSALAMANAIKKTYNIKEDIFKYKWPNDLLVQDKKLSGILLESEEKNNNVFIIIGIGVNLRASPDYAINMSELSNMTLSPEELSFAFIDELKSAEKDMINNGFKFIVKKWMEKAYGLNKVMTARLKNNEIQGCFLGVDDNGRIMLQQQTDDTIKYITSGEVFFNE